MGGVSYEGDEKGSVRGVRFWKAGGIEIICKMQIVMHLRSSWLVIKATNRHSSLK